jgi:ATP-binding protein involved in chromosome partitioning
MREALLERLRDVLQAWPVEDLSVEDGRVRVRLAVSPEEWPRREALRASAVAAIAALPEVAEVDVATAIRVRTRDTLPRGSQVRRSVAVIGSADPALVLAAARDLRARGLAAGIVDLDLSAPAAGAAASRPPVNSDERIVPVERDGVPVVPFARFIPVARLERLPPTALRAMLAQFLSLIVWPPLDVLLVNVPAPGLLDDLQPLRALLPLSAVSIGEHDALRQRLEESGIRCHALAADADAEALAGLIAESA